MAVIVLESISLAHWNSIGQQAQRGNTETDAIRRLFLISCSLTLYGCGNSIYGQKCGIFAKSDRGGQIDILCRTQGRILSNCCIRYYPFGDMPLLGTQGRILNNCCIRYCPLEDMPILETQGRILNNCRIRY